MRFLFILLAVAVGSSVYAAPNPLERPVSKRIALSFDDAPRGDGAMMSGEERTASLIKTLQSANTGPVVFFVTTGHLKMPAGRARIERYAKAGHLIASHTHSHAWLSRTDTIKYVDDIDTAEALLQGYPNRRSWLRFPFLDEGTPLAKRDAVRAAMRERGLMNGYVTVDNYDWYIDAMWKQALRDGRSVNMEALRAAYVDLLMGAIDFYDNVAIETLGRSPVHVLLLHENDMAAMFVGDLVATLRSKGWTIVSPDEAYADPINKIIPETLMTRQGHIGALAVDAGLDPKTLTHRAIEEKQIDAMLLERGVFGPAE